MKKLSLSRLVTVQAMFEIEAAGRDYQQVLSEYTSRDLSDFLDAPGIFIEIDHGFMASLVTCMIENQVRIDQSIHKIMDEDWHLEQIDPVLRAAFRAAASEALIGKTPKKVIISEYISVLKHFTDDAKFINFANAVFDRLVNT